MYPHGQTAQRNIGRSEPVSAPKARHPPALRPDQGTNTPYNTGIPEQTDCPGTYSDAMRPGRWIRKNSQNSARHVRHAQRPGRRESRRFCSGSHRLESLAGFNRQVCLPYVLACHSHDIKLYRFWCPNRYVQIKLELRT